MQVFAGVVESIQALLGSVDTQTENLEGHSQAKRLPSIPSALPFNPLKSARSYFGGTENPSATFGLTQLVELGSHSV